MSNDKDLSDVWDAIRSMRKDIEGLKKADLDINAEYLHRSYTSIVESLEVIRKDVDTLKSR